MSDSEDEKPLRQSIATESRVTMSIDEDDSDTHIRRKSLLLKRKAVFTSESEDDDDDLPLSSFNIKPVIANGANGNSNMSQSHDERVSSETDAAKKKKVQKVEVKSRPVRKRAKVKMPASEEEKSEESSDDDLPLATPKKPPAAKATNGRRKAKAKVEVASEDDMDMDESPEKPVKKSKGKEKVSTSKKKEKEKLKEKLKEDTKSPKKKKKEEEEEEIFRWWDVPADIEGDGSVKWKTLVHNGVLFPPLYIPLPSDVKMKSKGKPVDLPPESEEVAGFFGAMLNTEHAENATFQKNFFNDFKAVLQDYPPRNGVQITNFEDCDFTPMFNYYEAERAKKKAMSAAEKKAAKLEKDKFEEPFKSCFLDNRKEKVGNFRIEPPGLFRGRGEHPKKGALKLRVRPEDITINIGKGVPIPTPNVPGKWKAVIHDDTVTWLANWKENVNGQLKYVFLAAGSSLKGQSDMQKFEKARELKKYVATIRKDYTQDLRSKIMADRQRATAMYFIDKLALRAGNEKGEDEADTVGCCSLRCEHVTLLPPNKLVFDFLGKDSIRYYNTVEVDDQVFKNIRIFKCDTKTDDDLLFDRVNTTSLNKHLSSYMKGLTAKVFRTYNASITFQDQLDNNTPDTKNIQELHNAYNKANRMVAILCNHQRTVPKSHAGSMEKMGDKLRGLKYQRMKFRHEMFSLEPKLKRKAPWSTPESDLEEEWIEKYEEEWEKKEIEKAEKKFTKDNEKLEADGKTPQEESVLKARIKAVKEEFKERRKERGKDQIEPKRGHTVEKLQELIQKLDDKIKSFKLQMVDREEGKEVSLGTSKINYLDPRITAAWCKKHDFPIEKLFSKSLLTKFPWAMDVDSDWRF